MSQERLFAEDAVVEATGTAPEIDTRPSQARVNGPVRNQMEVVMRDLDSTLPEDHSARSIWEFLQKVDTSAFYGAIKAIDGVAGRPGSDPQVLLALWLYATAEGVGSARQLDRLCAEHDAYRWLRGGVPINYHMLSDFRGAHGQALDELLTEIVALMMAEGLVTLRHAVQDGMRTRASAGASSFRRKERLERCLAEAREQVERLAKEREHPDPGVNRRERAAQERAARERQSRVEEALRHMPEIKAAKERQGKTLAKDKRAEVTEPRVSTTDPEARIMKMSDGGFRPAYNLEIASDVDASWHGTEYHSQVIVGVGVVIEGSDGGEAVPMVEQIHKRTDCCPEGYLIDGGFATREDITTLERQGVTVYAPTRAPRTQTSGRRQGEPRPDDTLEVAAWRARMETSEAKVIYRERGATVECVNAHGRRHGLQQLLVRGADKVLNVLLLVAVAHNLLRWIAMTA